MTRLHVIGGKNHGKTRLIVGLVAEFTRRGRRVGTIKHTHHCHELDTPGKDSHEHRMAGAVVAGIISPTLSAIYLPGTAPEVAPGGDPYQPLMPMFRTCDLVIVEGDGQATAPKIEVWRACLQTRPLSEDDRGILAIVTDDLLDTRVRVASRSNVSALADWLTHQSWFG